MLTFSIRKRGADHGGRAVLERAPAKSEGVALVTAIDRSLALIRFRPDGTILGANQNFLRLMGYREEEIVGRHHSIFVDRRDSQAAAYREFWANLRQGKFQSAEYKRIAKAGRAVWIQATYNPVFDEGGGLREVVKIASDVTERKLSDADASGQIAAIRRVQAVVSFSMDGTILDANEIFLGLMGYTLEEIQGKHHSIFLARHMERDADYLEFWEHLRAGRFVARVFQRFGKGGVPVWIQASYNPILDMEGRPFKVVKYATDITQMMALRDAASRNAEMAAGATKELSTSISEISNNMAATKSSANAITEKAGVSTVATSKLLDSMTLMQGVVGLIREIAGRVNILALNAAIEAARAGEAGKGFAVVASEVKNLSGQTATATEKIVHEITEVQRIASDVSASVEATTKDASLVGGYVQSVAAAIEKQIQATSEIAQRSIETAESIDKITKRMTA